MQMFYTLAIYTLIRIINMCFKCLISQRGRCVSAHRTNADPFNVAELGIFADIYRESHEREREHERA